MISPHASSLLPVVITVLVVLAVLIAPSLLRLDRSRHPLVRLCRPASALLASILFIALIAAVGIGALYPPVLKVAMPLACHGTASIESQAYSYKPGQSGVSRRAICANSVDGSREGITIALIVYSTLIYGGGLFLLIAPSRLRRQWRDYRGNPPSAAAPGDRASMAEQFSRRLGPIPHTATAISGQPADAADAIDRQLRHLKHLHGQGLITDAEYASKKAELLARL